jgi:hypothetical protein
VNLSIYRGIVKVVPSKVQIHQKNPENKFALKLLDEFALNGPETMEMEAFNKSAV